MSEFFNVFDNLKEVFSSFPSWLYDGITIISVLVLVIAIYKGIRG